MNSKIVVIEIGAGLAVPTIRIYGEKMAKRFKRAHLIRINPVDIHVSAYRGLAIKAGGLEGLRALLG